MLHRWMRVLWVILIAACGFAVQAQDAVRASEALLQAQFDEGLRGFASGRPSRLVFAGFAMHSDSSAFRGDVELAEQVMRDIDPQAIVFKLANPAVGQSPDWPHATRENIYRVLQLIAEQSRPSDKVVLLFSSHGYTNLLAVQQTYGPPEIIRGNELQDWLEPLRGRPLMVLVSACYSGSLMPALRAPQRIVLTASASTRSSFGCQTDSKNTFFIEELLRQPDVSHHSIAELIDSARTSIEKRENALNLVPSMPQAFFGPAVQAWSRQPLASWIAAKQP